MFEVLVVCSPIDMAIGQITWRFPLCGFYGVVMKNTWDSSFWQLTFGLQDFHAGWFEVQLA